jgi:hypothetical protein
MMWRAIHASRYLKDTAQVVSPRRDDAPKRVRDGNDFYGGDGGAQRRKVAAGAYTRSL